MSKIRRKNGASGDPRPHLTTNVGELPGLPQRDEYQPGYVYWCGRKLYIGHHQTVMGRLFYLLADPPGRWHRDSQIEDHVFQVRTDILDDHEARKVHQRLFTLVSRLKTRMREHGLDDHAIIVRKVPGYVLLLFQDQQYNDGEAPTPGYRDLNWGG